MITAKMMVFLVDYMQRMAKGQKKTIKDCVYLNRIHKRIDRELKKALWLSKNCPDIFLDKEKEYSNDTGTIVCHRRLKALLFTIKYLNPKMEVELVLKNLDFPEENETTT